MLKKTMTTVDFGGTERTEDYYFNLTRAEIMEMELTTEGGLVQMINRITAAQSQLELAKLFKQIICKTKINDICFSNTVFCCNLCLFFQKYPMTLAKHYFTHPKPHIAAYICIMNNISIFFISHSSPPLFLET